VDPGGADRCIPGGYRVWFQYAVELAEIVDKTGRPAESVKRTVCELQLAERRLRVRGARGVGLPLRALELLGHPVSVREPMEERLAAVEQEDCRGQPAGLVLGMQVLRAILDDRGHGAAG